jgi:hypothetical protein
LTRAHRPQAGGNGGALETRAPAGLARLFRHPVLDWNLFSALQPRLDHREVRRAIRRSSDLRSASDARLGGGEWLKQGCCEALRLMPLSQAAVAA